MEDVKVEIKTVEIKSEASVIDFTPSQVENIIRHYVNRKRKLPEDASFKFTMGGGCSFSWRKEDKKSKTDPVTLIASEKKPTTPAAPPANNGSAFAGSSV